MRAGYTFKFYWQDNETYRKPKMLPAAEFTALCFGWIRKQLDNPELFPADKDTSYPE
jgi:hypothetical protein